MVELRYYAKKIMIIYFFIKKNLNILHKKFIGLKKSGSSNLVNLGSILNESARVISI